MTTDSREARSTRQQFSPGTGTGAFISEPESSVILGWGTGRGRALTPKRKAYSDASRRGGAVPETGSLPQPPARTRPDRDLQRIGAGGQGIRPLTSAHVRGDRLVLRPRRRGDPLSDHPIDSRFL